MTVTEALKEAADAANAAWTPERSIRLHVAPNGVWIEGRVINRDDRREYQDGRICAFATLEQMTENWLLVLIEQVREGLDRHAGTPLRERGFGELPPLATVRTDLRSSWEPRS